jgi:hypothetical protein
VEFIRQDHVTPVAGAAASVLCGVFWRAWLVQFVKCFAGRFGFFAVRVELEVGLVLGDRFVFLLHLLRDLGEGEVGRGVIGLNVDRVLRAQIGSGEVVVVHVELCDLEVLVDTFVIGLNALDLGQLAMDGAALFAGLGHVGVRDCRVVGR